MGDFFVVEIKYVLTKINNSVIFCVKEVLYLGFYNMKFDTIFENVKNMFVYRPRTLIVRYADGEIVIDLTKKNISGINSQTFNKLMTPEFAVENHIDKSGLRLTTLIDKKTGKIKKLLVACSCYINIYITKINEAKYVLERRNRNNAKRRS